MECIVPSLNIKVLAKALQSLGKIGDEVFIEAKINKLTFLTFNQSKTICGQFEMLDSFFSLYKIKNEHLNENSAIGCKIHMKTVLPMFKGTNLDKKLEYLSMVYEVTSDMLQFKVKYKTDDITMSHNLHLMDAETIIIDNYSQMRNNNICSSNIFFNELLNLFSSSDSDITFNISKTKVVARNYYVGAPQRPKSVRTQINLNSSEFALYRIKEETTLNFPLKPLRTAISFADAFNLNIGFDFDKGGRPLSISMKNPTFEVTFIVATIDPESDAQSTIAPVSLPAKVTQINLHGTKHNLTNEDLNAIANENWDEFDIDVANVSKHPGNGKKHSNDNAKRICLDESTSRSNHMDVDDDNIHFTPMSPRTKLARIVFKKSFEDTFHAPVMVNENILAWDSDPD